MSEIFKNAKLSPASKAAKAPKPPKEQKKKAEPIVVEGLLAFVGCSEAMSLIKDMQTDLEAPIKEKLVSQFITDGMAEKTVPKNFKITDVIKDEADEILTQANATATLVSKSASTELKDEEIAVLKKHKIPFLTINKVDDTLVINPAYADDQEMLAKVAEALSLVDDLPKDFIMRQRIKKRTIDPDKTMQKLFTKTADVIREVLPIVASISIRSQALKDKTHSIALGIVNEIVLAKTSEEKTEA